MNSTRLLAALLATSAAAAGSHEWNSPGNSPGAPPPAAAWSGRIWAGPPSGAPTLPQADHCRRAPQPIELPGPLPPQAAMQELRAHRGAADVPESAAAPAAEHAKSDLRRSREAAAPLASMQPPAPKRQGPAEPVTAGVVDDNADFGAYLAFRRRHAGLTVRDADVAERYRLVVHDRAGRPVPDADVRLFAAGRPQPLWARTDAGGQAWLHPRAAGLVGEVFEVQVSHTSPDGALQGRAWLKRGQRDRLQITLDGEAAPAPAQLDLVFLVDATGSMADEIHKLRASMQAMAAQIGALPSRPSICWGLVAYRDRGDEFFVRAQDFTDDLAAFRRSLATLQADGGGDTPEALNEALHTAVHRLSWRAGGATRLVVLVADAPPQLGYGAPWYDDDMHGALARGIKLFTIGASGLERDGEYIFRQLAQFTGGRFVFLTYADKHHPGSGPGRETVHDVDDYSVETLDRLVVRLVREELARRPG